MNAPGSFSSPPKTLNFEGQTRKAGLEIEFTGLTIDEIVSLIIDCYGGNVEEESSIKKFVKDSRLGDFTVELDWASLQKLAKPQSMREPGEDVGIDIDSKWQVKLENLLSSAASSVVPFEVSFPPVPINRLVELEQLRISIQEKHGKGTNASALNAFGLHLNPEIPSKNPQDILRYLQAFLLLYEWLVEEHVINLTRKLTPFIDPFPESYVLKVLSPDYQPDMDTMIHDYLNDNPTRNRPLDMLPLFAWLKKEIIKDRLKDELVRPRPTFHYRLPNSLIDDVEWTFAKEWNIWVKVEDLAESENNLSNMMRLYLEKKTNPLAELTETWKKAWKALFDKENESLS